MSCVADNNGSGAGAGAARPAAGLSAPLERSASAASHTSIASLQQSFFDLQPRRTPFPYQRADNVVSALSVAGKRPQRATPSLQSPTSHALPRSLSRPGKDFFEEEGEGEGGQELALPSLSRQRWCKRDAAAAPLPNNAEHHHRAWDPESVYPVAAPAHKGDVTQELGAVGAITCCTTTSSPSIRSPLPSSPAAPAGTTDEERWGQKCDVGSERHLQSVPPLAAPSFTTLPSNTAVPPFSERYAASANAYLRAAAMELAEVEPPETQRTPREIWERTSKATAALLRNSQGVPLVRAAAKHAPPKLMRPASATAQQRPTSAFSPVGGSSLPVTAASSVAFAHTTTSTPPIRGIPLFTKTHRPAGWASVSPLSSASSLRLSLEEYGRAQLQDEAVRWYHRCGQLEQQLTEMEEAFNRQSRLLAAQWRADSVSGVRAKPSAGAARASSVKASSAAATGRSPTRRDPALTSRSPDTLLRAYAYAETEDGYHAGQTEMRLQRVGSEDSQHCPSEGRKRMRVDDRAPPRGPVLGQMAEGEMQYRVPKAYPVSAEDGDPAQDLSKHDFGSQVHRGPRGADGTAASSSPPLLRASVGLQTDGVASGNASFARETRGIPAEGLLSAFTEATREDPSCLPSTPGPSVIMSKQYVAAVEEIEMLRARVDVAERKSAELQEMCAAHELRCDELETQLLGKEEQLLRFEQQAQPRPATPLSGGGPDTPAEAAAKALLSAALNPLIAQLQDLLTLVHPESPGAPRERGALAAEDVGTVHVAATDNLFSAAFDDLAAEGDVAAPCSINACPKSPYTETSTHLGGVAHLTSLVTQVRSAITDFSQRFAALQAELDVVRADRNELIGEQSEQVRLLQEQLLEKDTAQWRLLEDLHRAQEQLTVARAQTPLAPADGGMGSGEPTASRDPQKRGGHSEGGATATASGSAAQQSSFPVCEAVEDATQRLSPQQANSATRPTQTADTSATEVAALQEQLVQVRAAAAAGQEAQRRVLSERLEQAELQLKEARLRAEDEYDCMSGTIEALTRELADTKEALRVKEMSLRIALRESFSPPLLITSQDDKARNNGVVAGGPVAEGLVQAAASSALPSSMQLLRTTSRGSAASSSSPRPERESRRTSMSPSPPIPPHLQSALDMAKGRDVADVDKGDGWLGFASGKKRKPHQRIEDDGTLRTLPSDIVANDEDGEEGFGRTGQLFVSSAAALTTAIAATATMTSSSREKSSRGLTVSTGGGSQGASSLPHGCGDGSTAMLEHVSIAEETAPQEETSTPPRQHSGATAPLFTQEEEAAAVSFEAHRTISSSPPRALQRKSPSALLADIAAEEELPLPPPLRSPLFGTTTSSGSPSPEQQQRTPPPHHHATTYGARLGIYASASQGKAEPRGPRDGSELSAQPLSPEEKLRRFLSALSASPSPLEMVKESGRSFPPDHATLARRPTLHNSSDASATSNDAILSDVMVAAIPSAGTRSVPMMDRDETTPGRRPLSLYSASASPSSASRSTASRPSPTLLSGSPHAAEVTARHVQASLWRHQEAWQQQELILHALRRSPSL
ncbi:conserved hypothetical protein [Leishmania mexicana MHOM/GT/2001/U1103]|uniref:Uncharacterized protein n=1 Tax=Leishmania mexicana (strain MHOM/GT/2001/U1103) TaxID=929439 RepID=E9ARQ5_LEIMU|nr:conserved hypothetical protein [Leishmania mexicana MHOM/GT/2001/U1103]CBZ25626.1 conserved hypothetical protein [Leishmania mexicana MHOM/GT/2001/U1103]